MAMNDPLGDMLTRIRNAQMRRSAKSRRPARTCAPACSTCSAEGYIRGYTRDRARQRPVRVRDRAQVLRTASRRSARSRVSRSRAGACTRSVRELPRSPTVSACDPVDAEGRDVGYARPRGERRRRGALQRVLTRARMAPRRQVRKSTMSRIGKKPVPVPANVTADVTGQTVKVKGPKGELSFTVPDDVTVDGGWRPITVQPREETKRARAHVGHVAHADRQPRRSASPTASRRRSRSTASASAPR